MDMMIYIVMVIQVFLVYNYALVKKTRFLYYMPLSFFIILECFFQLYLLGDSLNIGIAMSFYIYLLYCILYMTSCELENHALARVLKVTFAAVFHLWSIYFMLQIMYFKIENQLGSIRLMKYYSYLPSVIDSVVLPLRDLGILIAIVFIVINQYFFIRINKYGVRSEK